MQIKGEWEDCQLTWLLGRNKTAYIPTVSAVLRAVMYSAHPHESSCSPDQENMPFAVDSLRYETSKGSLSPLRLFWIVLVILLFCMWLKGPPVLLIAICEGRFFDACMPGLFLMCIRGCHVKLLDKNMQPSLCLFSL